MRKTSVHSLKIYKIVATFIFKKVGFEQFGGNFGACTDEKTHFWPKKWAKARFCEPKVGRKNRVHFLKTALFWRFLAIFGQFAQIGC
jgi:hypothetical protein